MIFMILTPGSHWILFTLRSYGMIHWASYQNKIEVIICGMRLYLVMEGYKDIL